MERKDLKISDQTQMFIECIDHLNNQWEMVYKALSSFYGFQSANQIMQEEYNKTYDKLKDITQGFLMSSINDKMGEIGFSEI